MRIKPMALALMISCSLAAFPVAAQADDNTIEVGDLVTLGTYEQDGQTGDGAEDIRWMVLANEDDNLFLVSLCALDALPYSETESTADWESSSLRTWLNSDFLEEAFTQEEQDAILTTTVDNNQGNSQWELDPQNDTEDKVFLLSYQEAMTYLSSDEGRMAFSTEYTRGKGAIVAAGTYMNQEYWFAAWWLRSNGPDLSTAAVVQGYGVIGRYDYVTNAEYGVRPALWIPASYFE